MKPMLKNTFFFLVNDLLARGITPELKVSALTSYGNLKWEDGDTTRVADLYSVRDCSPLTASTFRKRFIKWFDEIIAAYHAAAAENLTEGQKVLDGGTVRTVTAFRKTVLRDSNGLPINQECPRSGVILLDGKYEVMAGSVKPYTKDNINLSQQILENPRSLFAVANNVVRAAIIETAYAEALEENDMFDGIIRDGLTPQQRAIQTRREGMDIYGEKFAQQYAKDYDEAWSYELKRNQAIRDEEVQLTTQIEFNKRQYIWEEVYSEEYKAIRLEVAHEAALAMDATFEENLVFLATPDMADIWYKHTDILKARILAAAHAEALALDVEYGYPARFEYVNANGHKQMQLLAAAHKAALMMAANYASADQMANEFLTEQAHTEEALGK